MTNNTLILLLQVILATEAFMLWNSSSLLLIQLQLKELRRNFPSIHKTLSIQEKSNQKCALLVPLTVFLLSNRLTKHQWVYSLLKSIKKSFHFPTDFWSQFTASLQNNSWVLVRGAVAFALEAPSWSLWVMLQSQSGYGTRGHLKHKYLIELQVCSLLQPKVLLLEGTLIQAPNAPLFFSLKEAWG